MSKIRIESEGTVIRVWIDGTEIKRVRNFCYEHGSPDSPPTVMLGLYVGEASAVADPQVQVVDGVAIDWSKAPDSARYAARDTDGSWYWHPDTPVAEAGGRFFRSQCRSASLYVSPEMWGLCLLYTVERPAPSSDWIAWGGGERPVPKSSKVEVKLKDGSRIVYLACDLSWEWEAEPDAQCGNITAYRVLP